MQQGVDMLGFIKRQMNVQIGIKAILLLVTILTRLVAGAASIAPKAMNVNIGTAVGNIAVLAVEDEGQQMRLNPTSSRGRLVVTYTFSGLDTNRAQTLTSQLMASTNGDVFTFKYRNSDGQFIELGQSAVGLKNTTQKISFEIPRDGINRGAAKIRIESTGGAKELQLDSMVLSSVSLPPSQPSPLPPVAPPSAGRLMPGTTWYWQLQGAINTSVQAQVYDIDLFDTVPAVIQSLKASGRTVICYFSAGSYEEWRPDAAQFPAAGLGSNLDGWPGERWLDVRNAQVRSIMAQRMDHAVELGCDGLEPDNIDGYSNKNGVGLTKQDQINYNTFLAEEAHKRGLLIALKNSTDLVNSLVDVYDFAVVEECFKYNECSEYTPFAAQNKAILSAEYTAFSSSKCTQAKNLGISLVFFNLDLNGKKFEPCN